MKSKPRCFGQCSEECCYEDKYEKKLSCLHECFLEMIEIFKRKIPEMQEINFDYYEHGILIHGKALLLFTIDFQEEKTIKETDLKLHILKMSLESSRENDYKAVFLITSFETDEIPYFLRNYLEHSAMCLYYIHGE